ncbi:MAG: trans-sulfuration enzyme family protein, partial [Nannocystaceae bacterium]
HAVLDVSVREAVEGAPAGLVVSSGMAAVHCALTALVPPGGRVVAGAVLYGGTEEVLSKDLASRGVEVTRFDPSDPQSLDAALERPADLVWCEAISNPLMQVARVDELAPRCDQHGAVFVVDATFAAGMAMKPLSLGADLVVHSATKFLNGHSDVTAGAVVGEARLVHEVYGCMTRVGSNLDPGAAWLLARGLKTLPLRWAAMRDNARELAGWLEERPEVRALHYPRAEAHASCMRDDGAMLTFELESGEAARNFAAKVEVAAHATSLGGIETLVSVPARSSHSTLPRETRAQLGITDGMVRVSVGIEDLDDLLVDFERALEAST